MTDLTEKVARAICAEECAFYGEPPCWQQMTDEPQPWPNPNCDSPGCHALATAACAALQETDND